MFFKTKILDPLEGIKKVNLMWIKYKEIRIPLRVMDKISVGGREGYLIGSWYKDKEDHVLILTEHGSIVDVKNREVCLNYGEFNDMIASNREKEVLLAEAIMLQEKAKTIMSKLNS